MPSKNPPSRPKLSGDVQSEVLRLRKELRRLKREKKEAEEERDEYFQVLLEQFKKKCAEDDWSDFQQADYRYTFEDIVAHLKRDGLWT